MAAAQSGLSAGRRSPHTASACRCQRAFAGGGTDRMEAAHPCPGARTLKLARAYQIHCGQPARARRRLTRRRRNAARFSPRSRRCREPRRIAAPFCAVLQAARSVASAAPPAGFACGLARSRCSSRAAAARPTRYRACCHAQCRSRPVGADVH